jgi:hypothetical protein
MTLENESIMALDRLEPDQWAALKLFFQRFYDNADSVLHSQVCVEREFYAGKCAGLKEAMEMRDAVAREAEILRKQIKKANEKR